jgi:transposase
MSTMITLTAEEYQSLLAERERLSRQLRAVMVERDLLKERLDAHRRRLFAARSEARPAAQGDLFLNEAEALAPPGTPVAEEAAGGGFEVGGLRRPPRGRKPLDPYLPREIVRHELPESERVCRHDGAALVEIGVEISEQLDIVPQRVRVIQHQRVKYACPCCDEGLRVTPAPARLIPKGLLTEPALAWVVTAKYQDALPLYRPAARLGRFGGDLSRNTLAASLVRVGEAVQPVINLRRDHLLQADLVLGDETVVQVLKEPGRAAQAGPLYAGIKAGAALMSDGYEVYNAIAETHGLTHLGCWAHARRYFVEAEAAIPKAARGPDQLATRFIAAIGELYAVETRAKDLTPSQRGQLRAADSRPVLERIETLLLKYLHGVMPGSLLGKALHYLSAQWPKLVRFVDNGAWPIDNNLCENAIRPFAIAQPFCPYRA